MKRLTLLMLSVFLLTLLSMPASAGSNRVSTAVTSIPDETTKIPVYLTVNASDMVDVTIEWDALIYKYDGKAFSAPGVGTIPSITVTNNNPQVPVSMKPTFLPDDTMGFGTGDFTLNFFYTPDGTKTEDEMISSATTVKSGTSVKFYAVPSGNPLNGSLADMTEKQEVGAVRITIGLPEGNP